MSSRKLPQESFFPGKAILSILSWFLIFQIKKEKPHTLHNKPTKDQLFSVIFTHEPYTQLNFIGIMLLRGRVSASA